MCQTARDQPHYDNDPTCLMHKVYFNVMYLSDIKSCVARTSIGAQFLSVGAQVLTIGAQDAPASCYELCVK